MMLACIADINRGLSRRALPGAASHQVETKKCIERFIAQHVKVPRSETCSREEKADDLDPLVDTIAEVSCGSGNAEYLLNLLVVLRISLRSAANRRALPRRGVKTVIDVLREPRSGGVVKECFRVILHMCYEHRNVLLVTEYGGVAVLLRFLGRLSDEELQANLLGALQSICYQNVGRHAVREGDGVKAIASFLRSQHTSVHTRAVGALHNLTADAKVISTIRHANVIPVLVKMLSSPIQEVCSAAAGALQNMSREALSRQLIEDEGAVGPLVDLLSSSDVQCQACAAGALYNLLIQGVEEQGKAEEFKAMLSDTIVLGMVRSCLDEEKEGE